MIDFDIKRFARLVKWCVLTDRKKIVNLVGGMTIGCVAAFIPMMLFGGSGSHEEQMRDFEGIVHGLALVFEISFLICGCWLFSNMESKQGRIGYMMLPASTAEKYAARYLMVSVGLMLCWFVAFCAADVIRLSVSLFTGRSPMVWGVSTLFVGIGGGSNVIFSGPVISSWQDVAGIVLIHSLYVLGGTVFNRRQFVLTSAVLLGMMICLAYVVFLIHEHVSLSLTINYETMRLIFNSFSVIVMVMSFAVSYRVFRRMQVINNKWINL